VADLTDAELVASSLAGNSRAFELIINRHYETVWRVAFLSMRDPMTAEELSQDTFLRAYGALTQWRAEASLRTWLCTICRRLCIDRARLKRHEMVSISDAGAGHYVAASETDALPERVDLRAALDSLPDEEREAFLLVHHYGHSSFEAAEILSIPASTLRSRVGRARQRLATALSEPRPAPEGGEPA
jgi:RNA polymerase sigma-70 factor (ECF subfamily)